MRIRKNIAAPRRAPQKTTLEELEKTGWQRADDHDHYANEHPEDRASRKESIQEAERYVDEFVRLHTEEFRGLILTYADMDAEDALTELREMFWARTAFPSKETP